MEVTSLNQSICFEHRFVIHVAIGSEKEKKYWIYIFAESSA